MELSCWSITEDIATSRTNESQQKKVDVISRFTRVFTFPGALHSIIERIPVHVQIVNMCQITLNTPLTVI